MWQNAHDAYLESRILSAGPVELVRMLYQASTSSVREARQHLADGDIALRCRCVSKAYGILVELAASLDHERGGDLSQRLSQLYDYMQRKLLEANFKQSDELLAEVLNLLTTLSEAWEALDPVAVEQPVAANPWAESVPVEAETVGAAHGWNF